MSEQYLSHRARPTDLMAAPVEATASSDHVLVIRALVGSPRRRPGRR